MAKHFLILVGIAAFLFFTEHARSDFGEVQVFVKDGVLFGVSEQAIVESDLVTGNLSIRYKDGSVFESLLDVRHSDVATFADFEDFLWISGQERVRDSHGLRGVCNSEANAVHAAITLVQNACAGGETQSCRSAQDALNDAQMAFNDCMRQFLQER